MIGALKNRKGVMKFANMLRKHRYEVFEDWVSPGPDADLFLWEYYKQRGFTYEEMICSTAARHNYQLDRNHLDDADVAIMFDKCGKSAHLEAGYCSRTKPTFLFLKRPPIRPDIMYSFLYDSGGGIFFTEKKLLKALRAIKVS